MKYVIGVLLLLSFDTFAAGCTQNNNTLNNYVGVDNKAGNIYASLSNGNKTCSCSHARFKPENTNVEMALSILVAAKSANKKVRIDFLDENNCNSAYRVYIH